MASAQLGTVLRQLRRMVNATAHDDSSDGELLERFRAHREEEAFVTLLKRHGPMVLHVCRRIQGNEHDAEDAFQATFLLLAGKASSIRKQDSVASWLHGVAHRLALAAKGQGARRQARERRAFDMRRTSAGRDTAWQQLQATLDQALRQVPQKYRAPLLLCYLEGKTQEEAAQQLGCPLGTIRSRIARGRDRLRNVLERQGLRLSATALATALAGSGASAAVCPTLLQETAKAALHYAAGSAPAALVSARAAALLEGGLKAMATMKLKIATAIVLLVGALGLGAGILANHVLAGTSGASAETSAPPLAERHAPPRESAVLREEDEEASAASQGPVGKDKPDKVAVRGRVLDADGKAVAGAKLYVPRVTAAEPTSARDIVVDSVGATDADGRFSLTLSASGRVRWLYLIAHTAGSGVDWIDLYERNPSASPQGQEKEPREGTLRLLKDVPITGRVVNTEGKPVAGVSVSATQIYVPANDNLDGYLAGWLTSLRDNLATPRKRLYVPLDGITGAVKTDKDGRFTVHGAGAERIAHVTFAGAGIAQSTPYVITRPGFDPRPYNDVVQKKEHEDLRVLNRFLGLYAPSLTFVAEAGRSIEGVVKDAATGKPLAGLPMSAYIGFGDIVTVVSDAAGKYRIEGLAKNARGYSVSVRPPKNSAYLTRNAHANDTPGYTPLQLDIDLVQGVVVTGRVVDKQTGKGVQAGIRFAPLPDNKFFASKPGFDNYRSDRTMGGTDKDGLFRIVTIPGKALVMVQAHGGEKFHGEHLSPYRRALPDPDHKDLFTYDSDADTWLITTASGLEFLGVENAAKVIDIKESGDTQVELFVDRGVTGRVIVQDEDGKPLAGAWLAGLTHHWPITYKLPQPTATVYALDPEKPRTLTVYHPDRKLGGTVTIRGDEKEPAIVKLGPLGRVTGRLLDVDGQPLTGTEVSVNARGIASELYRFANPSGKPVRTDKDGRFTLPGVVPGMSFYVQIRRGDNFFRGKPKIGALQLKAGEVRDLGERTMEVLPQ